MKKHLNTLKLRQKPTLQHGQQIQVKRQNKAHNKVDSTKPQASGRPPVPSVHSTITVLTVTLNPTFTSSTRTLKSTTPSPTPRPSTTPSHRYVNLILNNNKTHNTTRINILGILRHRHVPIYIVTNADVNTMINDLCTTKCHTRRVRSVLRAIT